MINKSNTVIDHLHELRTKILRILFILLITFIICIPFSESIYNFISGPILSLFAQNSSLIATGVTSPFFVPLKLALSLSCLIVLPYAFFELWSFISPGLYKDEQSFALPLIISSLLLFISGITFAFLVVAPILLNFFLNSAPSTVTVMTDISQYFQFIMKLIFGFGIAFQVPVLTFLLVRTGMVSKQSLKKARPFVIILFFIIASLLTPPDVLSQLFLAIPMWILFEIGLFLSSRKK
ncbi:twin-arginine translocase subunit TatC [Pseudomonadota bacterium]|nr:twin-arginine translocase subunit TatC [Pseudomonadota bacterium]